MKRVISKHRPAPSVFFLMFFVASIIMTTPMHAQRVTSDERAQNNNAVAVIGDYALTLEEFERQFIRNNGGEAAAARSTTQERRDFLELLVRYRLKVLEARDKGYGDDAEIQKELREYRNSLAIPYLTERALIDSKIAELHAMRQTEVRAAHILIRVPNDSLGMPDTSGALARAEDVLRQAKEGVPFEELAAQHSDDKGTAANGGDLFYFSAGMTVPAFDKAVYSLQKAGDIYPEPVQTMFGYHIVKLLERRPTRGELHVSHILVRLASEDPEDSTAAYNKIMSIRDTLVNGGLFSELAMRNSEDPGSAQTGGDLGWVGRRKFVPEFELAAFSLKEGELSAPVRTQFGYHLILINGERPPRSLEEERQDLKELYRRYSYEEDNQTFLEEIYNKYDIRINDAVLSRLSKAVDTTATTSAPGWYNKISKSLKKDKLVQLKGISISVDDAIRIIERNEDLQSRPLSSASLREAVELIGRKEALRLETQDLESRYPEFGALMREYEEGVLLFRAEQEAVWNRVKVEEDALREFWELHRADYTWPDRVRFSEIFVTSDSMANVLRDSLRQNVEFDELASRHTQRAGYANKAGDWGFQAVDANELSRIANTLPEGSIEGPMKFQYGYSIIKVADKDAAREKTFGEAQSEVSSRFQEYESKRLEQEWIDGLRQRYGVAIHDAVLARAFKGLRSSR